MIANVVYKMCKKMQLDLCDNASWVKLCKGVKNIVDQD